MATLVHPSLTNCQAVPLSPRLRRAVAAGAVRPGRRDATGSGSATAREQQELARLSERELRDMRVSSSDVWREISAAVLARDAAVLTHSAHTQSNTRGGFPSMNAYVDRRPSRLRRDRRRAAACRWRALNYLAPMTERPRNYTYDPPAGVPRSNSVAETHVVPILSVRPIAAEISLDREGFALVQHQSAVHDFYDDDEVRRIYYAEAERVLAEATGARRVFVFDHTVRRRVLGVDDRAAGTPRQPATRVHVDHTATSGPQRVRDLLGDEAEELLRGRVQVINLWRPIRGPLRDAPLAVCDARSVAPGDLVPSDLVYRDRVGETYGVTFNPSHRWFYVPGHAARRGAAVEVLRFGDRWPGPLRAAYRVRGPDRGPDVAPRESIELRTFVFH